MDIIDALSQEEVNHERNWLDLPPDVFSLIFLKLATIDILGSAQWVCTSWWKLSKQPHLFRSIHVEKVLTLFGHSVPSHSSLKLSTEMAREAIDRSCGQLLEFSVVGIATDGLLQHMSEKSCSLRCLRLVHAFCVLEDPLIEMAKKFPQLEEFEIIYSCISKDVIETFGRFCPNLKSCTLNYVDLFEAAFDGFALTIADNMPELRHLNLFGAYMTNNSLRAILDGCPHIEFLDLRRCFYLNNEGYLKEICKNIKVLRLPNDPIDDYEYDSFSDEDS